jgi:Leu/Phe-tRNA-protein transferase
LESLRLILMETNKVRKILLKYCDVIFIVYTWSNRQLEWYNSERRFIFAC